ncbi:3-dehydroquinate synthase [Coxiella endosymbiont of Amblyomma nuttalli]|uniref:3-dehydroquinate synthase n=1 Tax=Coxiella endosymbiont of Amblyomma nuttalli TaxID=2749996 RepID=UPI001BA66A33|nr:3-dehydroquinate synthase [Coxiella endosymbiont of Amblyomma nuttalli]QTS84234.1 3-dehydroquinate synthase [Coxiella endosymbiont of Amblyomma nuttalli]
MRVEQLTVNTSESFYPIYIGENLLQNVTLFRHHIKAHQVMIVTNETIASLYLNPLKAINHNLQCDIFILPDGEKYKNITHWEFILNKLASCNHHRDTTLIALGGGVVGDITGFAAACYQRGVDFIQVPTTLLAQVDASIGGKTAVNLLEGKNLIGAFHQPKAVIIDLATLRTLPDREFKAGVAEIIKAALIHDDKFFNKLEANFLQLLQRDSTLLQEIIKRACEIKRDIIANDEKEIRGKRALLNLGHTFAHAIERLLGYDNWLHGEAVAMGLMLAVKFSHQQGLLDSTVVKRIHHLLEQIFIPTKFPKAIEHRALLSAMYMDKKVLNGRLHLILLKRIGKAVISDQVTYKQLKLFFEQMNKNLYNKKLD